MKNLAVRLASTLALLALAILTTSCYTKPEKSEEFIKVRKAVGVLQEDLESTQAMAQRNEDQLIVLGPKVTALAARPVGSVVPAPAGAANPRTQAEIKTLETRIGQLETQLTVTLKTQKALTDRLAKLEAAPAPRAAARVTPRPPTRITPRPATARQTPAPAPKRVVYHTIEQGETLTLIAQKYSVTLKALCAANHLPVDAKALPGQKVFIPAR